MKLIVWIRWRISRKWNPEISACQVHRRTVHEGPEWNRRLYSFFNLDARWGEWLTPRLGRFTPGKETLYPLYRRLDGLQDRSGRVQKMSPQLGFDPRTVQPVASHYAGNQYLYRLETCLKRKHSLFVWFTCNQILLSCSRMIFTHGEQRATEGLTVRPHCKQHVTLVFICPLWPLWKSHSYNWSIVEIGKWGTHLIGMQSNFNDTSNGMIVIKF